MRLFGLCGVFGMIKNFSNKSDVDEIVERVKDVCGLEMIVGLE
jgi:hypothetical protein